jgi:DNA-binding HxlR family transcriptional regulator
VRRYDQYCPIAHALGLVGERWSLLVVRELLDGPKRYTDLVGGLPKIGTNILAARLRDLEAAGVVAKRKLPPPAASTVYELTQYGQALRPVIHELARWGIRSLGPPTPDELEPGWLIHALELGISPLVPSGTIAFRVGEEEAAIVAGVVVSGVPDDADVLVETDPAGFYHLFVDRDFKCVHIEGDAGLLEPLVAAFSPTLEPLPA